MTLASKHNQNVADFATSKIALSMHIGFANINLYLKRGNITNLEGFSAMISSFSLVRITELAFNT